MRSPPCWFSASGPKPRPRSGCIPLAQGPTRGRAICSPQLARALHREPVVDLAGRQSRTRADLPRFGRTSMVTPSSVLQIDLDTRAGDPAQAGAGAGRLRPGPVQHQPRVGRAPRRHPSAHLAGTQKRTRSARPLPSLRVRRLRDLHRPVVLPAPALLARPRHGLRRGPRARRGRDGSSLVRERADGEQGQHLQRLHRLRPASGGRGDRPARCPGRAGRVGRRAPHRRRGERGTRAVSPRWWRRSPSWTCSPPCSTPTFPSPSANGRSGATRWPTRRPTSACSPTRPTTTSRPTIPTGRPAPTRASWSRPASTIPGSATGSRRSGWPRSGLLSPSTRVLLAHRNGRRPRRALGALRRLEGGGAGLRLPARRLGHAVPDVG